MSPIIGYYVGSLGTGIVKNVLITTSIIFAGLFYIELVKELND